MAKYLVEHRKNECIGCGACAAISPEHWVMEGEFSHLIGSEKVGEHEHKKIEEDAYQANKEAADSCPVPCIFVKKIE